MDLDNKISDESLKLASLLKETHLFFYIARMPGKLGNMLNVTVLSFEGLLERVTTVTHSPQQLSHLLAI